MLGRRAPAAGDSAGLARAPIRVLRADGRRIDLTSRDTSKYLVATQQTWQKQAFDYRDLIGELRYAVRLLSTAVARVRFYPAEIRPWPQDPIPLDSDDCTLDKQLRLDAIANFERLPFDHNPDGFTARIVENLKLPGEVWVHIDADDRFTVRSISEITASQSGQVVINTLPGGAAGSQRVLDPDTEELLRLWVPHPEYGELADSPMRALAHVAEDVVLAGREQRAAARSRLAANGILLVPQALSMLKARLDDDEDDGFEDTFFEDLVASFMAPITSNDEDPAQIVPIVLRGDAEDLEKVRHVTVERADSKELVARQTAALLRLLKGMDVQPEQVDGVGGMNHWGAFIIDSRAIKDQVQPTAETVAACLMQAYMSPGLTGDQLGHDPSQVRRIMIACDTSELTENPNRGQDARDAHDAITISDETFRRELGFGEEDKPTEEEFLRRLAASGKLPVDAAAALLGVRHQQGQAPITVRGETTRALPAGDDTIASPGATGTDTPVPDRLPDTVPTSPVTASAAPSWLRVDVDLSQRLSDIDADLTSRFTVAADAALSRVLDKAGARARSAAQRGGGAEMTALLRNVEPARIPSVLGRDRCTSFAPVTDLIADDYSRLKTQITGWLEAAAAQAADVVVDMLGVDGEDATLARKTIVARLGHSSAAAWPILEEALHDAAEEALFDTDALAAGDGLLPALDVSDALAAAGGDRLPPLVASAAEFAPHHQRRKRRPVKRQKRPNPAAGYATGPVVEGYLSEQGAIRLGWQWNYRPEIPRPTETFDPHKQLDGLRFTSWDDPALATGPATAWIGSHFHIGDHRGDRCGAAPLWIIAEQGTDEAEALRKTNGNPAQIPTSELKRRITKAVDDMRNDVISKPRRKR